MTRAPLLALAGLGAALGVLLMASAASAAEPEPIPSSLPPPRAGRRRGKSHGDPSPYRERIRRAAARHLELRNAIPNDPHGTRLVTALIDQESRFDPQAVSHTGAAGLAQFTGVGRKDVRRLMTLREWDTRFRGDDRALAARLANFNRPDAFDPPVAIEAAALYLASLLSAYNGHVEAALTAYNAGGKPARIVLKAGSHQAALPQLLALPARVRSQSPEYAPEVLHNAAFFAGNALQRSMQWAA